MTKTLAILLLAVWGACATPLRAADKEDETPRPTLVKQGVTLFGAGYTNTYDNYLSPLEYTGFNIGFLHTSQRRTHWKRVTTQAMWRITVSDTENPAGNRNEYGGRITFQQAWHYNWRFTAGNEQADSKQCEGLQLRAGLGIMGSLGGLYNTHLGNNPAQAYAEMALTASVAADYGFRLWHKPFTVSAQLDAPFIGMMFGPRYGQSYYNIFQQGGYDHNIVCTWPGNCPTLRGQCALDLPLGRYTVRLAYVFDLLQAKPNNLRQHTYNHSFMIGWVKRFAILR